MGPPKDAVPIRRRSSAGFHRLPRIFLPAQAAVWISAPPGHSPRAAGAHWSPWSSPGAAGQSHLQCPECLLSSFFTVLCCLQSCLPHCFSSFLTLLCGILPFLTHFFPEGPPGWLWGSALPCGGVVGAVWSCRGLAWGSSGCSSQGPSTAPSPLNPLHQHMRHCIKVQCCFSDCGKSEISEPCGVQSCQLESLFEWAQAPEIL